MLLNRSQYSWAWFTLLATLVSVALYLLAFHPDVLPYKVHLPAAFGVQPHRLHQSVGNSPLGLAYGVISYAIFIFAVALNTRKKFPSLRVGRAQTWLRAHIWLTILTLPLVFMHAAFHFGGAMTSSLMWLYLLVMVSGFYGLALQQFMPRLIKSRVTLETIYEEIPFLKTHLLSSAMKMRSDLRPTHAPDATGLGTHTTVAVAADPSETALLDALEHDVIPFLAASNPSRSRLAGPRFAGEFFRQLHLRLDPAYHNRADLLASWCEQRRQMELQTRYHHWLHAWLLIHVPASFLLIILTGWHAVAELFLY